MERIKLKSSERLDDLLTKNLKIIQSDEVFSFSMDAVLLARFCQLPQKGNILDLCTGNGVIPLLMTTRTNAHITAVEIQERLHDMAVRNIEINQLEQQVDCLHIDLKQLPQRLGYGKFDAVTVNPPYLRTGTGDRNMNEYMAIARHEMYCTLENVLDCCTKMVRTGGKVAMVHRPARLAEIIDTMRDKRLEPKRIRFVHPYIKEEANMVLIEAIRDGKPDVRLLPPLIVYTEDRHYCPELMEIYYGSAKVETKT